MRLRRRATALAMLVPMVPLYAQTASTEADSQKLERVEITGSMIKRTDKETPAPVAIITRQDIERSGATSVEQLLRMNTSVTGDGQQDLSSGNGWASGTSSISLRGMGSAATLTLLNGRRMAPAAAIDPNTGQGTMFNVSSIPLSAIERVEILKDGASSLYGSDALAGVINIILRRDYTGQAVEVSASQRGDGLFKTTSGNVAWGRGDLAKDGFNIFGVLDLYQRDAVAITEKLDLVDQDTLGSLFTRNTLNSNYSSPGNFYTYRNGLAGTFKGMGNDCPTDSQYTSGTSTYCRYASYGKDLYYVNGQKRASGLLRGSMNLDNGAQITAELLASRTESRYNSASATISEATTTWGDAAGNSVSYSGLVLPADHPDNPTSVATAANPVFGYTAPTALGLRYRFTDIPRYTVNTTDNLRLVVGAQFEWGGWDWDAGFLHHWQDKTEDRYGFISVSGLTAAIADQSYRFGGTNSASVIASVSPKLQNTGTATTTSVDLRGSRQVGTLSGGAVMLGVGTELRYESFKVGADDRIGSGDIIGLGISQANGSRTAAAAFAELQAPLLKDLETQTGVRIENYNDFGSALTGKVGAKYKVAQSLAVRATYSNGFRAPSLSQISPSKVFAFTTVQDPSLCPVVSSSNTHCTESISSVISANSDLKPEQSNSLTAGLIFNPTSWLDMTLDGYSITRRNVVDRLSAQEVVDRESEFPGAVIRNADGQITQVIRQYRNMSRNSATGVEWDSNLRWRVAEGHDLRFTFTGTRVLSQKEQTEAGGEDVEKKGYYGVPLLRMTTSVNWAHGPWNANLRVNYTGKMKSYDAGGTCSVTATTAGRYDLCQLSAFTTVNLSGSYSGFAGWKLTGIITNLFDKAPPTDVYSSSYYSVGYNPSLYDVRGRVFTVTARKDF
ncbi:iron complex outermembrane recepter protein [Roseateles sp. YR242]|uniref:TonB-dependent receptor n=1 Tax=Roseateles sp. YR242 TaxID=1855305 RepID=UPI0008D5CF50|nr:TonB-dependent receptor [Roseateles sp. YR242]SEK54353.1 iron complex outermembrane recepter protein [Roseateles sp. YR242]